jgi:hypothetical protein
MTVSIGVDGSVVDVPGVEIPGPDAPATARKPCRVRVTLERIDYGGDNIGARWSFKVTAGSSAWLSGPMVITHGTTRPIGVEISNQLMDGMCGLAATVPIGIQARETTFPFWPFKFGEAVRVVFTPCRPTPSARQEFIPVLVSWRWPRRGFPFWHSTAVLTFVFTVRSQCE